MSIPDFSSGLYVSYLIFWGGGLNVVLSCKSSATPATDFKLHIYYNGGEIATTHPSILYIRDLLKTAATETNF